ncbi:hypothetical protein AVEN_65381-1 [Araneus ventricosus]|uniref:Uncharacterized protein n=1 Tax=Araneus ventricosus TaxID=182803 RepID=A0A4Y2I1H5_ARAVE|nr:hypothetical protein AVEN_65381-1 [Araneus ventricosus]
MQKNPFSSFMRLVVMTQLQGSIEREIYNQCNCSSYSGYFPLFVLLYNAMTNLSAALSISVENTVQDKEKRELPDSHYRQVQKKLLLEKSAKNTQNIELFFKLINLNLSLNVDTVEVDNEEETPAVTSQLAPPDEVVDSTAFYTQKSLALIVPESKSSSSALKSRDVALFRGKYSSG